MKNIYPNIDAANDWLKTNRSIEKFRPITFEQVWERAGNGNYLSIEADAKTTKGSSNGYLTGILYLAPHSITGVNLCPFAVNCVKPCLFNAGRGQQFGTTRDRIVKTLAFLMELDSFTEHLIRDVARLKKRAKKLGMVPAVRLNGTSDIRIERAFIRVLEAHPDVQFYDYTKDWTRFEKVLPANYHLTFSYDGTNLDKAVKILGKGHNVAVVFGADALPTDWHGFPVIDGDATDLRFLDPRGVIVGLTPKGKKAKDDAGAFVQRAA